jgi:hypothetical protein
MMAPDAHRTAAIEVFQKLLGVTAAGSEAGWPHMDVLWPQRFKPSLQRSYMTDAMISLWQDGCRPAGEDAMSSGIHGRNALG